MDLSCSRQARLTRSSHPGAHKIWTARLRRPLRVLTDRVLSVQLPPGDYELSEHDDIHYDLYASAEFSVILRVTELDHLRTSGDLVINGVWP
jgi:hypothetical protein